jgi:DNA-binding NarL/FixJ family response regulator
MDAPSAIRIVLAEMPGLMGVVVRDAIKGEPDMRIVGEITGGADAVESVSNGECDVMVAALSEGSRVPRAYQQLLFADVPVPFIALDPDGRRFQAYARSVRREFAASELLAVIRKLANAVNCKEN